MSRSANLELTQAFLEVSSKEWEEIARKGIARNLVSFVPFVVEYQDNVEDAKKFFLNLKETSLVPKLEEQLENLDKVRLGITSIIGDDTLDPKEVSSLLSSSYEDLSKAYTLFSKVEAETVSSIRQNSISSPKEASLTEKVRSYWNHIDEFWAQEREALLGKWKSYFNESESLLRSASSSFTVGLSPNETLLRVESLLKKRHSNYMAAKVAESRDKIKQYYVEEYGLIPAYMGSKGNWKVEKDDCPDPRLPDFETSLTDRFAFCRLNKKECPSFNWSMGSYVKCRSFSTLREASFLSDVTECDDSKYIKKIKELAETDPFLQMLFHRSSVSGGKLYWANIVDDRLETMLEQYPKSDRKGNQGIYRVYIVANEPIYVSGEHALASDRVLLETLGEGAIMPKTADTIRVAGPMMRITFTANALMDPAFRDYLRKKRAVMSRYWTWDIPFDKEDDISFILSEIKEEFGYPVVVMEILEDADSVLERNFSLRRFSDLPILRHSSALSYIPKVEKTSFVEKTCNLKVATKLVDVANNLPEGKMKAKATSLADSLRVSRQFFVLTPSDIQVYADGAIGIIPEPGMEMRVKDPDTGSMVQSEVTEVIRDEKGSQKKGLRYKVRTLDTGKEIELSRPWTRPFDKEAASEVLSCGCDEMSPPEELSPEDMPVGYFPGEDGQIYIFRFPEEVPSPPSLNDLSPCGQEMEGPPSPYGRPPGDVGIDPLPHPPLSFSPPPPLPPAPPVTNFSPSEEHGPLSHSTQVFAPVEAPEVMEPSESEEVDSEAPLLEEIKRKTGPGLKFTNLPSYQEAPSVNEDEVEESIDELWDKAADMPEVKDIKRDLLPTGKPVIFVYTTSLDVTESKLPTTINGFEVRVAPLHDSMEEDDSDKEAADVLVAPSPDRPWNGDSKGRMQEGVPYNNQISEPPPMGDPLVKQVRDVPKF